MSNHGDGAVTSAPSTNRMPPALSLLSDAHGVTRGSTRPCSAGARVVRGIVPPRSGLTGHDEPFCFTLEVLMARSCAICGKVSMGGYNPQSTGSNRVRAHHRIQAEPQPF